MKKLAVVIYSYKSIINLEKCIENVLNTNYIDRDIYVIGYLYSNNEIKKMMEKYRNSVEFLFCNEFKSRAIAYNEVMKYLEKVKKSYEYYLMLDNCILIEKDSILESITYLDKNNDVGMLGFKLLYDSNDLDYYMYNGGKIDWENFKFNFIKYSNNDILECDFVSDVCFITKNKAIDEVGKFDDSYWQLFCDADLCIRMKLKNYKIIIYNKAISFWHIPQKNIRLFPVGTYYYWRNATRFFLIYSNINENKRLVDNIIDRMFDTIYECNLSQKEYVVTSIFNAIFDFCDGITGAIKDNRFIKKNNKNERLKQLFSNKTNIILIAKDNENYSNIVKKIEEINEGHSVKIRIIRNKENANISYDSDLIVNICTSVVVDRKILDREKIYIDRNYNIVYKDEDFNYLNNYEINKLFFRNMMYNKIFMGVQNQSYLKKARKVDVIIFGTGSTSQRITKWLNSNVNVVCYCDNNNELWNRKLHNKVIIGPQNIKNYHYDYIIIASQFNSDIYEQLINLEINREKIFDYFKFCENDNNYINEELFLVDRNRDVEILATGISYISAAIKSLYMSKKIINLANPSQDLYYDYNIIKYILNKYKNDLKNIKYIFIGLCYYSFQYDMSLSAMKSKVKMYYDAIGLKHNLKNTSILSMDLNLNKAIGDYIFFKEEYNNEELNVEVENCKINLNQINEKNGEKQALLDGNKNYPNTVKENIEILKSYLTLLADNKIVPIIVICPVTKYYSKIFSKRIKDEFYKIIFDLKETYEFEFLDYSESDLFVDEDFYDVSHLNEKGAKKFSGILEEHLQKYNHK